MALYFRERAEDRAIKLWKHYDENGKLSLSDFKRITGTTYDNGIKTFETYGIEVPLVYNSRKEKARQKAIALKEKSIELKQDYLTITQAAKVLNEKASRVLGIEGRILRYGFDIQEIRVEKKVNDSSESDDGKMNGTINPLNYPSGLQCVPIWFNPVLDEIHYLVI